MKIIISLFIILIHATSTVAKDIEVGLLSQNKKEIDFNEIKLEIPTYAEEGAFAFFPITEHVMIQSGLSFGGEDSCAGYVGITLRLPHKRNLPDSAMYDIIEYMKRKDKAWVQIITGFQKK